MEGIESFFDLTSLEEMKELVGSPEIEESGDTEDQDLGNVQDENIENDPGDSSDDEQTDEENNDATDDNEDGGSKDSPLLPYAKLLVAEGVLRDSDIEGFDGTADGLIEAEKKKFAEWQEQYKESFDPRVKWLQDNIEAGVPLEELLSIDKQNVIYSNITPEVLESDVELQKNVVRNFYKTSTKFTDERIEREINRLDDLSELKNEALTALPELVAMNEEREVAARTQAELQKTQRVESQRKALNDFKTSLEAKTEIITGIELSKIMKDKVYGALTTVVSYDQNGTPMNKIAEARSKNPMEFETTLAYLFELTNGFKDFAPIASKGKKQAIAEFEQAASRIDKKHFNGNVEADPRGTRKTAMNHIDSFLKATSNK